MTIIGTQNNTPIAPTIRHHQTRTVPDNLSSASLISFLALIPEMKAIIDPMPASQIIEKTKPHFKSELTLFCKSSNLTPSSFV